MSFVFIPVSLLIPVFSSRFGITRCVRPPSSHPPPTYPPQAQIGTLLNLASGWVRYAGTSTSLSAQSGYVLLMFGQVMSLHPSTLGQF